jgi:predicted signal transduction protein with EAL and GGDEF domain/DNA-binding response OmpR family regulator
MNARRRVLVADDEPVAQLIASSALEAGGYEVVVAADGHEALRLFEETRPDCVILDVVMPGLDGLETCRRLRATPGGADMPVLILTSHGDVEAVGRAYEAGASDFLTKGSSPRLLTERVRFLLREHDGRRALLVTQGRLHTVQAMARVGHWELDARGGTVDLSDTVRQILDQPAGEDCTLETLGAALGADDRRELDARIAAWRSDGGPFRLDCQLRSGSYVHIQGISTGPLAGGGASLTLAIQDVSLLREAQREAHRLAFYDPLTGLPNRRRFAEVLDVIVGVRRQDSPLAVMAVRVRGADRVLESGGQAAADQAVLTASRRLHAAACGPSAPGRILAHLGGGDFALALPDCDNATTAATVAEELLAALRTPVDGADWTINLVTRVGVSFWPQDATAADTLLDEALATAGKLPAGSGYAFFTPAILAQARRRLEVEAALRGALARDEFRLVYQPRVDLGDLHLNGAEALLRWTSPALGEVPPMEFISVAEDAGMIDDIGDWIIDRACREASAWRRAHQRAVTVSVNVSSRQLASPARLLGKVRAALALCGLPGSALELELTESMVVDASPDLLEMLQALRGLGVSIALDDFGTGYSSLGYLRKLPVDCLKIDRAFVADLTRDPGAEGVLEAILAVAAALRLRTVAEGIETNEQCRIVAARGCREGQGYLFSRPLEAAAFESMLAGRAALAPLARAG